MSDTVTSELSGLRAEVVDLTGKIGTLQTDVTTANATIAGFSSALAAAIAGGHAQGLTPDELQAFTDLHTSLQGASAEVASASSSLESTLAANPLPVAPAPVEPPPAAA